MSRDDYEVKFWLQPVTLAANYGFSPVELRTIERHVKALRNTGSSLY